MKLRKGRIALLVLAALAVWLVGVVVVNWALLSRYTYSMERVSAAGIEQVYQPGEREARATASLAMLVLTCGMVAALAAAVIRGHRQHPVAAERHQCGLPVRTAQLSTGNKPELRQPAAGRH